MLTAALLAAAYATSLAAFAVLINSADQRAWSGLGDHSTPRSEALGAALALIGLALFLVVLVRVLL